MVEGVAVLRLISILHNCTIYDERQIKSKKVFGPSMKSKSGRYKQYVTGKICEFLGDFYLLWIEAYFKVSPSEMVSLHSERKEPVLKLAHILSQSF